MEELGDGEIEGVGDDGDFDNSWKGLLSWLIPVLLIVGGVYLFRALRSRPLSSILERGVTPVAELQPGIAIVSGVATMDEPLISPLGQVPCLYWGTSWQDTKEHAWPERRTNQVQVAERYDHDGTSEPHFRDLDSAAHHLKATTKTKTNASGPLAFTIQHDAAPVA